LTGIPAYLFCRLQSVLNEAARLYYNLKCFKRITDALNSLHWRRNLERFKYAVALLTYHAHHGSAPRYLGTFASIADPPGRLFLRSARSNCLLMLSFQLSIVGSRALPVAGPQIWNDLPYEMTSQFFVSD
jgi:predicted Rossmann fold nucleotide-binding protein DprA/Smf involved in DNA uptake